MGSCLPSSIGNGTARVSKYSLLVLYVLFGIVVTQMNTFIQTEKEIQRDHMKVAVGPTS